LALLKLNKFKYFFGTSNAETSIEPRHCDGATERSDVATAATCPELTQSHTKVVVNYQNVPKQPVVN